MAAEADLRNQLSTLAEIGVVGGLTDGKLLQIVLDARDGPAKAAFTTIVLRHGPMVLRVCRHVLGDTPDADDAFQATFLILARKLRSVRRADSLASWLHGVARRVAVRARSDADRRRSFERAGASMRVASTSHDASWPELHEEIARLPTRYREPIVLCYLEGLTTEAAAERLQCPRGTILSRLARGKDRLRERLIRRGLAPVAALSAPVLLPESAPAMVAEASVHATVHAALRFLARSAAGVPASAAVLALTEGNLHAMFWTKLKTTVVVASALCTLVACMGTALAYQLTRAEGEAAPPRPVANDGERARPVDASTAMAVPLPPRDELYHLLRDAAKQAMALAREHPVPASWTLTTIANAQAKAGDRAGARETFAAAAHEAEGTFGGEPNPFNLWRVGYMQVERGLKDEARTPLRLASKHQVDVADDASRNDATLRILAMIAKDQAAIGARDDARETADRLLAFADKRLAASTDRNARFFAAPDIAGALTAVGDYDGAFGWSDRVENHGAVLGAIALAAARCLDRETAGKFVSEAATRLAKLELAEQKYNGLSDLAEVQARLGDIDAARRSAGTIGEGPKRVDYDMTDGQPYAFIRVALVQREAGDLAGARATLRDAFRSIRNHPQMRMADDRYSQVASIQLSFGDIDGAKDSLKAMKQAPADSLASLGRAEALAGRQADARATLAQALARASAPIRSLPNPNPAVQKVSTVKRNATAQVRMNEAEIQAMAGNVLEALQTLRTIDEPGIQRFALQGVVKARATAGDVAGALRLALDESKTPDDRRAFLFGLGDGIDARLSLPSP